MYQSYSMDWRKISVLLVMVAYYLTCVVSTKLLIFPDTAEYASWHGWYGGMRPFVYPAMLQVLSFKQVVVFQYALNVGSIIFLCFCAMQALGKGARYFIIAYLFYVLSPCMIAYNACMLTESINFSLWFMLCGLTLLQYKTTTMRYVPYIMVLAFFMVFLRYANVIPLLFLLPVYGVLFMRSKYQPVRIALFVASILLICVAGIMSSHKGHANNMTLLHVISARALLEKNHTLIDAMAQDHFPVKTAKAIMMAHGVGSGPFILSRYPNQSIAQWLNIYGQSAYLRFLITHPRYTWIMPLLSTSKLLALFPHQCIGRDVSAYKINRSVLLDLAATIDSNYGDAQAKILVYLWLIFLLICFFYFLWALLMKRATIRPISKTAYAAVCYFFGSILVNSIIIWHLDTIEVPRHLISIACIFYLGLMLLIAAFYNQMQFRVRVEKGEMRLDDLR